MKGNVNDLIDSCGEQAGRLENFSKLYDVLARLIAAIKQFEASEYTDADTILKVVREIGY